MRHLLPSAALGLLLALNLGGCDAGSIFGAHGLFSGSSQKSDASGADASGADGEGNDGEEDGVDCVDGIDAATGAECDGGPAANQDDGEESDAEAGDDTDDVECEDGVDEHGDPCEDTDTGAAED